MEIEAKFTVIDEETFLRLQEVRKLAGFTIAAGRRKQVRDTYLDTADRAILAVGYACRRRIQEDGVLITLKGLGGVKGAVHRREELEILLPEDRPPAQWAAGPLRDRMLQLIGEAPLEPLFELRQTRIVRPVRKSRRLVAELSLDDVHLAVEDGEQAYFELEAELTPRGSEDDLAAITACLQDEWNLQPMTHSKFERALDFLGQTPPGGNLLTPRERALCAQIAKRKGLHGLHAQALLALDEGATQEEAGQRAGRSARTVRRWLASFRRRRLAIFPDDLPAGTPPPPRPEGPKPPKRAPEQPPKLDIPPLLDEPGLEAGDSMAEAARKTLYFHFLRMLHHEPGTRLGEDIEALHDMRVATRRMRAALQVFGDYVDMEQMAPFAKGLRRTGRALGRVRDLDVFWEKTQRHLDTLPPERQDELASLQAVWEAERKKARKKMLVYIDSDRFARFKEQFGEFLQTPAAGALPALSEEGEPQPRRLRHVVPVVVYESLAAVRAYDEWVTGPDVPLERLHQLRIATKRLRYTLEFFREVLGPEVKTAIKETKGLQDHLGDLQDAVVASALLRDFLTWGTWGHAQAKAGPPPPGEPIVAPGVAAYLAARQTELQRLVDTFPQIWAQVQGPEFAQTVAAALAALQQA